MPDRPSLSALRGALPRCGLVTDYDDSIGGEGEIVCGSYLIIPDRYHAYCAKHGHKWLACNCGGPTCRGWIVDSSA